MTTTLPRILLVTSCTGEKQAKPENQLTQDDLRDKKRLHSRETELAEFADRAAQLYIGAQHLQAMEGVSRLRHAFGHDVIDVMILSAGYGLISEERKIVPYEVTFNTMKGSEVNEWAEFLGIHRDFEQAIASYDLIFLLLGENYLRSLSLPVETSPKQTLIVLGSKKSESSLKELNANTFFLPLSNAEAKRYGYGLVGLKGFLFKKFASLAIEQPERLEQVYKTPSDFEKVINSDQEINNSLQLQLPIQLPQTNKMNSKQQENHKKTSKDEVSSIPDCPPAPNRHLGMQYFMPEWDDTVDPGYDFINDQMTSGRDTYKDDVYAHQIFDRPNYDGILVSKGIVDKTKKKKASIEEIGVHKYIRFSGKIMGDCGAFSYIKQEVPPYTSEQVLEYYQTGGFDYGVSVDHLIVGPYAEPGVREKRYELTIENAEDFLRKHQAAGYNFVPVAAVQGWSPETYAEGVKACIEMGYDYIALGGLARERSPQIIEILKAIRPHLTPNVRLHLFGVARIDMIPTFRHLGITSFDSASPLRRAWLGSGDNYHSLSGKKYSAIRIPPVDGHGVRIKRLIEAGIADRDTFKQLEQNALEALRQFDAEKLSLDKALEKVLDYDEWLELPKEGKSNLESRTKRRAKHEVMYRKLLEDVPWKICDCTICQEIGVEVVIFRGNNRNRRRGFHNTYVFYKHFKELLNKLELEEA